MKVLVCGGRHYAARGKVFRFLDDLQRRLGGLITHIVTGSATGADSHAEAWAEARGMQRVLCPANWGFYGRRAGPIRNALMLRLLMKSQDDKGLDTSDFVVAFPGGPGTEDMVTRARAAGWTVVIVEEPQNVNA
jgi:predicted Rossmann-fold nucleotide-binding protein